MVKKSNVNIKAIHVIRAIVFLLIGLICFASYSRVVGFLTNSNLFAVKDVLIDTSIQFIDVDQLRRLKGRNIFCVDIQKIEQRIKAQYPQIAELRVMRELPDRIKVLAKKREPVFQIPFKGKYILVDGEGVAIYNVSPVPNLPVVSGALRGQVRIVWGAKLLSKPLDTVLQVISAFKEHPHTARLKITTIDVTNSSKIDVGLGDTMHVILDQDSFATKLNTLEMLVTQKKIDFLKVKYIDLRFNEPVLGGN